MCKINIFLPKFSYFTKKFRNFLVKIEFLNIRMYVMGIFP